MFKLTYIYERFNDEKPFYWDTEEGRFYKDESVSLGTDAGLIKKYDLTVTEDQLTSISIYEFDSKEDCINFLQQINAKHPNIKEKRTEYIMKNNHMLTGHAPEPIFFSNLPDSGLSTSFTVSGRL